MKVLLVEDHPSVAKLTVQLLRVHGHEVSYAATGKEALASFELATPDLALIDVGLPGMDGYELAQRIRENARFDQVVLVALTGYTSDDDRDRSRIAGFDHHFAKPMDLDGLHALQRRATGEACVPQPGK